ncbi:MAG TPA: hypothetical protein VIA81_04775 [Acidimicrobiia bacterium]|jgi:hypothetical protein
MSADPAVDAWFEGYEHPAKDAMLRVRDIPMPITLNQSPEEEVDQEPG